MFDTSIFEVKYRIVFNDFLKVAMLYDSLGTRIAIIGFEELGQYHLEIFGKGK